MITAIILFTLFITLLVISLCFKIAGGAIKLAFKLILCLPCAILCGILGVVLCCTLILIPLGIGCFKLGGWFLNPFKMCTI